MKNLSSRAAEGLFEPDDEQFSRMRRILLMMYRDILRVCRENGLTLLLGGGSALGAVRGGGMIPWDDDVDLMLSRADYEKFKAIFDRELGEKYVMQVPNAPGHEISNLYMKVILRGTQRLEIQKIGAPGDHGLWVDIFPVEYAPDCALLRFLKGTLSSGFAYLAVSNYLRRADSEELKKYVSQSAAAKVNRKIRLLLGAVTGFTDYRKLYNLWDRLVRGEKKTNYVTVPTGIRHYGGETHPISDYFPPAEVEFEGEKALMPGKPEAYLAKLYGPDYLTPPPENRRERHFYVSLDFGPYGEM